MFYDVSAWCVPLAFDLIQADLTVNAAEIADMSAKFTVSSGSFELQPEDVAAIIDGHGYYTPRTLYQLLNAGIIVKVAMQAFSIDSANAAVSFEAAPSLCLWDCNLTSATAQQILNTAAQQDGVRISTTKTGLTREGADLGSAKFVVVERPKLLLIVGRGAKASEAGEVWHLMDRRFRIPLTICDVDDLSEAELSNYNVLVMVSGRYPSIASSMREKLKAWIENGGTFLSIGTACEFVADQKWGDIQLLSKSGDSPERRPFALAQDDAAKKRITGAIVQTTVDVTHPLAFGLRATLPVIRDHIACI